LIGNLGGARLLLGAVLLSAPVAATAVGCSSKYDGVEDGTDASTTGDAAVDVVAQADASGDAADASGDADAGPDAASPGNVALLVAYGPAGGYGAAYKMGVWEAPVSFAADAYQQGGGGIAVTPGGHGYVAFRPGASNQLLTTKWTGTTWPAAVAFGLKSVNSVSLPATASSRVYVAAAAGGSGSKVLLDTFDDGLGTATFDEDTGAGDSNSAVAVAATSAAEPVVVVSGMATYEWVKRTGTVWSAAKPILGLSYSGLFGAPVGVLVKRAGADQIFGFFVTSNNTALSTATFSAGTWSSPVVIATDTASDGGLSRNVSAAALPDGRIAVAYVTSSRSVRVGLYDGVAWDAFGTVPGVSTASGSPLAMAPGVSGATLELAFIGASNELRHVRMTGTTWAPPALIDSSRVYSHVSLASF
jgi:hypothetical protein